MQKRYIVESRFETDSTGKQCDQLLNEVIDKLQAQEEITSHASAAGGTLRLIVRRGGDKYSLDVETVFGDQEMGFLLDISVSRRGDAIDQAVVEDIAHNTEQAVRDVFPVLRRVQ